MSPEKKDDPWWFLILLPLKWGFDVVRGTIRSAVAPFLMAANHDAEIDFAKFRQKA